MSPRKGGNATAPAWCRLRAQQHTRRKDKGRERLRNRRRCPAVPSPMRLDGDHGGRRRGNFRGQRPAPQLGHVLGRDGLVRKKPADRTPDGALRRRLPGASNRGSAVCVAVDRAAFRQRMGVESVPTTTCHRGVVSVFAVRVEGRPDRDGRQVGPSHQNRQMTPLAQHANLRTKTSTPFSIGRPSARCQQRSGDGYDVRSGPRGVVDSSPSTAEPRSEPRSPSRSGVCELR